MRGGARFIVFAALATSVLGCRLKPRGPEPEPLLTRDVTLYVAVTDAVAKTDTGNVAAMVDAIEADLREEGHTVTIVAARSDETPPANRLEVQVLDSDSGDASLRGAGKLGGFFAGGGPPVGLAAGAGSTAAAVGARGKIVLDAYVVRGGARPTVYLGRIEASSFGAMTDEGIAAGERSGHAIASRALRGSLPAPAR